MTLGELAQVEVQVASRSVPEEAPQKVKAVALKRFAFDRACEIEADGYAVKLLKDSGADPATLVAYLANACRHNRTKRCLLFRHRRSVLSRRKRPSPPSGGNLLAAIIEFA